LADDERMADEQAQRGAGTGDARAGQLESDDAARGGEAPDSLTAESSAESPAADTRAEPPAGDPPIESPAVDAQPAPDGNRPALSPVDSDVQAEGDVEGEQAHAAAQPPSSRPSPRWQFWRGRPEKKRKKAPWWELPVLIAVAIAVAVLIKTFLIQPFYIPSESMEKTLHGCPGCSGDRVLVNKLIYDLRNPHPGDIVVFRAPADWDEEPTPKAPSNPFVKGVRWFGQLIGFVPPDEKDLIKRVIAVGGQTVQCCDSQGRVQVSDSGVNGPWRSLDEPYIYQNTPWDPQNRPGHIQTGSADQRTFGPVTLPPGRLWVMGDHRGDSADSRFHCLEDSPTDHKCGTSDTTVATSSVIGKAVLIAWPPSRWRTLGTPGTFKHAAGALPAAGGALVMLPAFVIRRRRRR
jgi:signal peptidase I